MATKHRWSCIVLLLSLSSQTYAQNLNFSATNGFDSNKVADSIIVAAAANLASVGDLLKSAFEAKYAKASVTFVYGASGALSAQIQNGAPYQLFLSADLEFPKRIFDAGLAAARPQIYARGMLILFSLKALEFKKGLAVLSDPTIKQFALASPEIAPYGKAGREALVSLGLWDLVKAKIVTAQSISQAIQFTIGATGIGLINKSALYSKNLASFIDKEGLNWYQVDDSLYSPLVQAYVVLKSAASNQTTMAFAGFLSSREGKAIFLQAGYALP